MSTQTLRPDAHWQAYACSVRGASHRRSGAPNQDCGRVAMLDNGAGVVLAVADGHGDALHARSDRGSRFAVDSATTILKEWIGSATGTEDAIRRSAAELPRRVLDRWRALVASDLERAPPTDKEIASIPPTKATQIAGSPDLLYGSTLIGAAINDRLAIHIQIGDGDLLLIDTDDTVRRAAPGRDDLPVNQTESLCQRDAGNRFRTQLDFFAVTRRPVLTLASTDGYCNSFADDAAFRKVGCDIKKYFEQHGSAWVTSQLEGWLEQTSENGSGDDITVALAWRGPRAEDNRVPPVPVSPPWWRLDLVSPSWGRSGLVIVLVAVLAVSATWVASRWAPQHWKRDDVVRTGCGNRLAHGLKRHKCPGPNREARPTIPANP